MSAQSYIRSFTPDDFPTLTPLPELNQSSSPTSFFANVSWQTWLIVFLILTLLGINVFAYLAKGTEESVSIFYKVFAPILGFFGYNTLEVTKQTIETGATGTKAGVDIIAGSAVDVIDNVEQTSFAKPRSGQGQGIAGQGTAIQGHQAPSSLPVQNRIQESGSSSDQWNRDSLDKALQDSAQNRNRDQGPLPSDSASSLQTTGKAGWCFIGEEKGLRSCSEIGVNDMCMSGDVFPTQSVCMNPNLRA